MNKREGVCVALGGIVGAGSRYYISTIVTVPLLGTFIVNILGCILIGCIFAFTTVKKDYRWVWPFLATGFCGGFTTMSTLSMELVSLLNEGNTILALVYILSTLLLGISGVLIGYSVTLKAMHIKEVG
ncbi:FluC/FEX family fluoride channel [Bacillus suaedaesalsae]|uniref:Fluoride-specific ion channel FluC n=1 Tax=Bacillus suaedaesalsae TaxID=2810349 RepID=A0ABS2DJG3_9BACI|nr:CrcB family protein [Bacillus suaedaesalsae]MBM6617638.1 CrcB family protein [Bacillus suaedaesalsae]